MLSQMSRFKPAVALTKHTLGLARGRNHFGVAGAAFSRFSTTAPSPPPSAVSPPAVPTGDSSTANPPAVDKITQGGALVDPSSTSQVVESAPVIAELGYYPSDLMIRYVDLLHVSLDLPYWTAIIAGTVMLRTMLLPITIKTIKNGARMAIMRPELEKLTEKIKKNTDKTMAKQMHYRKEMQALFKKHQCSPMASLGTALTQLPIFMSAFFGLRKMGEYVDISQGGAYWFTDLAVADATYILPAACSASFLAMVELGADGMNQGPNAATMKTVMRVMGVAMLPLTVNIPQSVLLYWCTSNAYAMAQALALRAPGAKAALGIPEVPPHLRALADPKDDPIGKLFAEAKGALGMVDHEDPKTQEVLYGRQPPPATGAAAAAANKREAAPAELREGEARAADGQVVKVFSSKPPIKSKKYQD
mmetsp:Transcript_10333/g.15939  ORF Transcript_10333/g.15939 Transcript_10333/m.15939 type:complete len:419 (+) Transcript_10333:68-1324(+)